MPLYHSQKQFDSLYIDFEYFVRNYDELVLYVSEIILGRAEHISRVIRTLNPKFPKDKKEIILNHIDTLKNKPDEHVNGFLFQMISWIALSIQYKDAIFYQDAPHKQPAMHGFDGLAVILTPTGEIDKIIITEDKCTEYERDRIRDEVFPDIKNLELHKEDHGLSIELSVLLKGVLDEDHLLNIEDDVYDLAHRIYRIGITRSDKYKTDKKRLDLFKGYDQVCDHTDKRTASTIHIPQLRSWISQFRNDVISHLTERARNV